MQSLYVRSCWRGCYVKFAKCPLTQPSERSLKSKGQQVMSVVKGRVARIETGTQARPSP